jgi:phage shock protein PspC (stress-responsive transcriptional regulator)
MTATRLARNLDESMLGGVAAGIADRYEFDVTVVRVAAVLLAFATGGLAIIGYLLLWLLLPTADEAAQEIDDATAGASREPADVDELTQAARTAAENLAVAAREAADAALAAARELGELARRSSAREEPETEPASVPPEPAASAEDEPAGEDEADGATRAEPIAESSSPDDEPGTESGEGFEWGDAAATEPGEGKEPDDTPEAESSERDQ